MEEGISGLREYGDVGRGRVQRVDGVGDIVLLQLSLRFLPLTISRP
jgi:hypothetical protein